MGAGPLQRIPKEDWRLTEGITTAETQTAPGESSGTLASFVENVEEPEVLVERRREAWGVYESTPMPTRRSEEWRYTDLSSLAPERFVPLGRDGRRAETDVDLPAPVRDCLSSDSERSAVSIQHNGSMEHLRVDDELREKGVVYAPLSEVAASRPELLREFLFASDVAEKERKLWSLHSALLSDGYVLYVPANVALPHPVHAIRYLDRDGTVVSTHSLIIAEPGARLTCIDEYVSPDLAGESLSLNGVEIFGAENAIVRYLALQRYGAGVLHFSMQHANTGRDSMLSGMNVNLGADLSRADVTSHLDGAGAESEMLALWFGDGHQHFDHHTLQHHKAPSARSDLLYKGALSGSARSVFRGLIRVNPGAQLTDAYQTNRNLLLSPDAEATALPNLEIEADDVRCSHGASVGQVDETQLFYLMSRGLDRHQAERLLVFGFFQEVLNRVLVEGVRERIQESIEEKIGI